MLDCFRAGMGYDGTVGAPAEWSGMSGVSLPVTRPSGRAVVVAGPVSRAELLAALGELGYEGTGIDDPYAAMAELCRRPLVYRALVVSLAGVYREELTLIAAVKRRFPHVDVWVTHTDGRQAALAEAMRLGADGLLAEDGLHRIVLAATAQAPATATPAGATYPLVPQGGETVTALAGQPVAAQTLTSTESSPAAGEPSAAREADDLPAGEPVLTADELRALLHEQPSAPPAVGGNDG